MADTVTTKNTLRLDLTFADNSTDAIILADAKVSLTANDIEELESFMLEHQPVLSNDGALLTGIKATFNSDVHTDHDIGG